MLQKQLSLRIGSQSDQKQRRVGGSRSKNGCVTCKRRHIKCDETIPTCRRCLKAGFKCSGPQGDAQVQEEDMNRLAVSNQLTLNPNWTHAEGRAFNHFATDTAPRIGEALDKAFWRRTVLPGARIDSAIFKTLLANVRLSDMSFVKLRLAGKSAASLETQQDYELATRTYRQGLRLSLQATQTRVDVGITLMASILHVYNEIFLGHIQQASKLMVNIFALIASSQDVRKSRDSAVLGSLVQLMTASVWGFVNSALIPRQHRVAAMERVLSISSYLGTNESLLLRMEMISVIWEMGDSIHGIDTGISNSEIESRWSTWRVNAKIHQQKTGEEPCLLPWQYFQAQWNVHLYGMKTGRVLLEHCLDALLRMQEDTAAYVSPEWEKRPYILDLNIMPFFVYIAWYWRTRSTYERMKASLEGFAFAKPFVQHCLEYLEQLTELEYEQSTAMELDLFGKKPRVLQMWHAFHIVSRLAEMKPEDVSRA